MSLASILARGRSAALGLMTSDVTIKRPSTPVENADGTVSPSWTSVYSGAARVSGNSQYEANPAAGGRVETVQRYILSTPVGTGPFEPGDVVKIADEPNNTALVGRFYRIAGPDMRSQQTAQRMFIEDYNGDLGGFGG